MYKFNVHPCKNPKCNRMAGEKEYCFACDVLAAELAALKGALKANMAWIGPPPTDKHSFDSVREDAWKLGQEALKPVKEAHRD